MNGTHQNFRIFVTSWYRVSSKFQKLVSARKIFLHSDWYRVPTRKKFLQIESAFMVKRHHLSVGFDCAIVPVYLAFLPKFRQRRRETRL